MIPIRDLEVYFLSYDEPCADAFFADLKAKHPAARRIHGVKGFDNAHKAAARNSRSPFLITIDADNIVDPTFFALRLDSSLLGEKTLIYWPARNEVNGLVYGNGAIKLWPRSFVLKMQTHENAVGSEARIDFLYNTDLKRVQGPFHVDMHVPMSTSHTASTPFQAFRAGFRAALRLTLVDDAPILFTRRPSAIGPTDLHRLMVWSCVGADVTHGIWSIYGARLGCVLGNFGRLKLESINNSAWFAEFWSDKIAPAFKSDDTRSVFSSYVYNRRKLENACRKLGRALASRSNLKLPLLSAAQSAAFKALYVSPITTNLDRMGNMLKSGIGVERCNSRAYYHYAASAAKGEGSGMHNFGRVLTNGPTQRDYERAIGLQREAAHMGNAYALHRLATMHMIGYGWGIGRDHDLAVRLLEGAASRGFPLAQVTLGRMLRDGAGVTPDRAQALLYLTFSAFLDGRLIEEVLQLQGLLGKQHEGCTKNGDTTW